MADAPALGAGGWPCRFKSCRPHGKSLDFFAVIRYNVYRISNYVYFIIGLSPSGKAQDFDSCITLVRIQLAQLEIWEELVESMILQALFSLYRMAVLCYKKLCGIRHLQIESVILSVHMLCVPEMPFFSCFLLEIYYYGKKGKMSLQAKYEARGYIWKT